MSSRYIFVSARRCRPLTVPRGEGIGPLALLACPPGELHELGLVAFGLVLRERGWRIAYVGADTPPGDIAATLDVLSPAIVVLAAVTPERFLDSADEVRELASRSRVGLAGAGASSSLARELKAESLAGGLVDVAEALTP